MRARVLLAVIVLTTLGACTSSVVQGATPRCPAGSEVTDELVLEAQSVPTADLLPCLTEIPPNWSVTEFRIRDGETAIALTSHSEAGGSARAVLTEDCDTTGATEEFSGQEEARLFVDISTRVDDSLVGTHYYKFAGGCVTYSFNLRGEGKGGLYAQARSALGLTPRSLVEDGLEREADFEL